MKDCLFCKIVAGEIPCNKVYENDAVLAFRDINPQAPVHVLIVPKAHMDNILQCDGATAAALTDAIRVVAAQEGVAESGFRLLLTLYAGLFVMFPFPGFCENAIAGGLTLKATQRAFQ